MEKKAQKKSRVPWVHGTPLEEREILIMYKLSFLPTDLSVQRCEKLPKFT